MHDKNGMEKSGEKQKQRKKKRKTTKILQFFEVILDILIYCPKFNANRNLQHIFQY